MLASPAELMTAIISLKKRTGVSNVHCIAEVLCEEKYLEELQGM